MDNSIEELQQIIKEHQDAERAKTAGLGQAGDDALSFYNEALRPALTNVSREWNKVGHPLHSAKYSVNKVVEGDSSISFYKNDDLLLQIRFAVSLVSTGPRLQVEVEDSTIFPTQTRNLKVDSKTQNWTEGSLTQLISEHLRTALGNSLAEAE